MKSSVTITPDEILAIRQKIVELETENDQLKDEIIRQQAALRFIRNSSLSETDNPDLHSENARLRADNISLRIANEIARPTEVDELRVENASLRAALEKRAKRGYQYYCPSCGAFSGHTPDCKLQEESKSSGYKSARGVLHPKDDEKPEMRSGI